MKVTIGKTYKVKIDDCCVRGKFESKLTHFWLEDEETEKGEWKTEGEYEIDYGEEVKFENGVELTCYNGVKLEEV